MATYYVDASGGSPGGYTNFYNLLISITLLDADIIEVVDNGEIDDSGAIVPAISAHNVIIRSYAGNTNKPTIKINNTNRHFNFNYDFYLENLKMYKAESGESGDFILINGGTYGSPSIKGCEFWAQGSSICININGSFDCTDMFVIEGNIFHDMSYSIYRYEYA